MQCQGQDQPKLSVALDELGQHDGAGCKCGQHGRIATQADLYHEQVAQTPALKRLRFWYNFCDFQRLALTKCVLMRSV